MEQCKPPKQLGDEIVLVGDQEKIQSPPGLCQRQENHYLSICHASQTVGMHELPASIAQEKARLFNLGRHESW